jgi:hypothetical protein
MQYRCFTLWLLAACCASAQSLTPPTGDEFTIAWAGDPHYSAAGGSLDKIAAWLTNNAATWRVQAFVSVGDNVCRAQANQTGTDDCFIAVGGYTPLTRLRPSELRLVARPLGSGRTAVSRPELIAVDLASAGPFNLIAEDS